MSEFSDKEEAFWRNYFGDVKDMEQRHRDQRDAMEYAARQAAGIPHNMFDDIFGMKGSSAAEAKARDAEVKKKFREAFHKRQYGRDWQYSYFPREDEAPEPPKLPDEVFFQVTAPSCYAADLYRLMEIVSVKKRADVRLDRIIMYQSTGFKLIKRRPKRDPNAITERVLSKDEVTVETRHPINNQ